MSDLIEIKLISPKKGRGAISKKLIPKGTVLEEAHICLLSEKDYGKIENTILGNYIFDWDDPEGDPEYRSALAMSQAEFFNHSYAPNLQYIKDFKKQVIRFVAIRDINRGEEITINYNAIVDCKDPTWFEIED